MNEKIGRSRAYKRSLSTIGRILLIILIICLSITCFFGIKILRNKEAENIRMSQDIENLNNDIKNADEKNDELSKAKNQNVSDEEYESLAREELGLIKKDEIVIKPR